MLHPWMRNVSGRVNTRREWEEKSKVDSTSFDEERRSAAILFFSNFFYFSSKSSHCLDLIVNRRSTERTRWLLRIQNGEFDELQEQGEFDMHGKENIWELRFRISRVVEPYDRDTDVMLLFRMEERDDRGKKFHLLLSTAIYEVLGLRW